MRSAVPMWMIRVGWCLIAVGIGVVCLSPLLELLPVEVWRWLSRPFLPENSAHMYYRIVPSEGADFSKVAVAMVGALLVAWGHKLRAKK